ncbi:undecaprenyldiphospho-muramoylpentapeptide beta-N-acetylglucosaminyltransferase [Flammeovirgaceae bacterium SG7u.132]|nr:undecaprenyldiphospho-muramoylpentapeptide beta-N-acetylglucosaminyltransferase [Flammeovirgaceae bacterium SG7u.132]
MPNEKDHIKVIISGGGTGGHVYPAIAIANALKERNPKTEILFVGAEGKMEMEKVPLAGYEIIGLWISGLQRRLTWKNLLFPIKLISSSLKSRQIIRKFKPDVAVGVGGYASSTIVKAAQAAGLPTVLQEQNGYAGLTNKLLSKNAKKICVAYPGMETYFPKEKIVQTGNPVRQDIVDLEKYREEAFKHFGLDPNTKTLLVLGGSLGARTINNSLKAGVELILAAGYQVIWQTGKFYIEEIRAVFDEKKLKGLYFNDFLNQMNLAYACADVVVSRAGALSISELCLTGKPSILVPSPNVAEDHQTKNAMALVNEGAAILVKDVEANKKLIGETIDLLKNEDKQAQLSIEIKKLARPNAAQDIAAIVEELANKNG